MEKADRLSPAVAGRDSLLSAQVDILRQTARQERRYTGDRGDDPVQGIESDDGAWYA